MIHEAGKKQEKSLEGFILAACRKLTIMRRDNWNMSLQRTLIVYSQWN